MLSVGLGDAVGNCVGTAEVGEDRAVAVGVV